MKRLIVITLMIISAMLIVAVKSYGEQIKICVNKKFFLPSNLFETIKYSDILTLQERGFLRIVDDLNECNENERPRTFYTPMVEEMPSRKIDKKIDETESSSKQYALSISKTGSGRGTVILYPSGVENNSAPVQKYNKGTLVVLTASPDENSTFAGWKGDGCLGDGMCVLTMSSDMGVTATFHKTSASGTVAMRNTERSVVPAISKKETVQHETKKDKKQTMEKPSQPQKPSEEKPSQPQKPSELLYAVQVGAFRDASHAKALQINLARKGYYVYILTSKSELEGEFHKVLIGRFSDREDAKNLTYRILKMENLQTFVTSFETRQKELEIKQ